LNATHLADQGTLVQVVQRRLGHRSPTTALGYYTHVNPGLRAGGSGPPRRPASRARSGLSE